MAHFAKLDNSNKVIRVDVLGNVVITDENDVEQEQLGIDFLTNFYGGVGWYKQTSYNENFRKNFAAVDYTYDGIRDAFIAPQPYPSWTLNEDTCGWEPPIAHPGDSTFYEWDEATTNWVEVEE